MTLEVDKLTGETWMVLDKEELKMGFLAQCVEKLAKKENSDYISIFDRLENADLTKGYILKHYETLHTESMDNVIDTLSHLLNIREN